jgi:hypothetical protein
MADEKRVKRLARKVVQENLKKAAVIACEAEHDFESAQLMPPEMASEVRWMARAKEARAEKLLRHAARFAAAHSISTVMVPGQAKVGPVIIKKGRGGRPGPGAVNNDTNTTSRRVASAV